MEFYKNYLVEKNFSASTIRKYVFETKRFLLEHPNAKYYCYSNLVDYMHSISNAPIALTTRKIKLQVVKKYFDFLIETGAIQHHPCSSLYIKGNTKRGIIFYDLFTSAELELLLNRTERYEHLAIKNKLIISFLIYQGLLPQEICGLKLKHIDAESQNVFIKGGRIHLARRLPLQPLQIVLLEEYLNNTRNRLLKTAKQKTDFLLLNFRGKPITVEDVGTLVESFRYLFPERKLNTKTIRDSVLSNLFKEKNYLLEEVQYIAGHRWVSSTLRLKPTNQALQHKLISKFHPLG
ncbi:MAG: tyrosine-type recombinase/integrase [Bacteroidetes bacterium]|nr:tyrosine-type recombinase/integrase [Bacteroidota bacterium]